MDPRVIPEQFLGPQALIAVFRNAGGRPNADVVRTIAVLQSLVVNAEKMTVMVVHHTGKLVSPPLSSISPLMGSVWARPHLSFTENPVCSKSPI